MKYTTFIGIDVSKETLDVAVLNQEGKTELQQIIENSPASVRKFLTTLEKEVSASKEQILFCLEPTGHYSNIPVAVLLEADRAVWIATPTDIKNSIGMQRGKNDKIDAFRIAQYAYRFQDKARLVKANEMQRLQLQQLLTEREMLIKDKAKYSSQMEDYKGRIGKEAYSTISQVHRKIVKQLEKAIIQIEKKLETMITDIPDLKKQYELLKTIPGVGKVLAQTLVVFTNGFVRFNNARAFACHAGIAPFNYSSGSSIRGKNRVSHRANKRLKSLLHMAALAAIKAKGDLKKYYQRKIAEGKNKMSVLNAIRNKIIHRVFAVLKRNTEYRLEIS